VYLLGTDVVSQNRSGTVSYYGYDASSNARYLTGSGATVTDTYLYDAFGTELATSGGTSNELRYSGERKMPETGLTYLRARYLNTGTGRFWTRDAFPGRTEDPQSLHRYLYVAQNPVNNIDPSGNDLLAANLGRKVHAKIGEDFREKFPGFGISGPSIGRILRERFHVNFDTIIALFPDLVNANPVNKEIYEIKPINSFAFGQAQLEGYLQVFNYFDPTKGWQAGSSYTPPLEITIDPLTIAIVSPPVHGVILYKIFSVQEFAKKRAINVGMSHSAQINDSVGVATLTSLLGGFAF